MRKLLSNKSKFLAALCCLCLGLASLFAGVFSFVKLPASADEVVDANAGFYVEKGASFRYDDVVPAIRFSVALTEDQWEAYKTANAYTEDMAVKFDVVIHMANRPNQDGTTSTGYTTVSQEVTVKAVDNFFANNPGSAFTVKPAIMLTDAWNGETTEGKTSSELYALYAGAEFHVAGIKLTVNGAEVARKDTTDYVDSALTLRSVRSVAASLLLQGKVVGETNIAIAENFIKDAKGVKAELVKDGTKYFYDKYADTGVVDLGENAEAIKTATSVKTTLGSTNIAVTGVDDGVADLAGVASLFANDGNAYSLNFDCVDKIYAFNNVIAATEIFYAANGPERLNARFAINKTNIDAAIAGTDCYTDETATNEETGETYTLRFYDVDRGYYVLGEDISFGTSYASADTNTYINHEVGVDLSSYGKYSGLFGFGGTFDGNGHAIHHLKANPNNNGIYVTGLFGALAYGAKVFDVAFIDAHKNDHNGGVSGNYNNNQRFSSILGAFAGSVETALENGNTAKKNGYNYLVAKYNSTDSISVDNCYFSFYAPVHNGHNMVLWDVPNGYGGTSTIYAIGGSGVVLQSSPDYISFSNCVLETYNHNPVYGHNESAGVGWIAQTSSYASIDLIKAGTYELNDEAFENCYVITADKEDGEVATVYEQRMVYINDTRKNSFAATDLATYGYANYANCAVEAYAANDLTNVADGTQLYSGLDSEGKWVFEGATETNGYTNNVTVYHYSNIYRYNNYVDMSANNTASTEGFNDNWTKVGNAVIWKGLADATAEKKLDLTLSSEAIGVGDVVDVTASFAGNNVTTLVTLSTNNDEVLSVNNVNKSFTVLKGGEATLYVTAGAYTAEYTVVATTVNETPVTVSSNASLIYGADAVYSIPYVANGNDLVATDFLSIYQQYFADNTATISAVYLLDETGAKTALTATTVEGVAHYAFANAGNVKNAVSVIIDGSKGYMSFADISTVTGVIADVEGFNYIPSTEESRAGYYVLANDFNNTSRSDGRFTIRQDSILGVHRGGSDQMGYSFGGFDEEKYAKLAQNTTTLATAQNSSLVFGMYNAFIGTFDGLGHTIDNMFVDPVGLLGGFTDEYQPSTLKNVKFSNVRAGLYAWNKPYEEGVTPAVTMVKQSIIATLVYAPKTAVFGTLAEEYQIKLDNVVIEIATSAHRNQSNYFGYGDLYWTMFRGGKYMTYNKDGTYKGNGNFTYQQRSINKVAMDGVVFKVPTAANVGQNNSYNYGGTIFSYGDEGSHRAAYQNQVFAFKDLNNVYIISAPNANGKVACVTSEHTSESKLTNYGLAKNDFYSIFTEAYSADGNTGLYYYTATYNGQSYVSTTRDCYLAPKEVTSGWGYVTTTAEDGTKSVRWIYAMNVGSYGQAGSEYELASNETFTSYTTGIAECTYTIFYPTSFERYDDYAAAVNAGVTQIGNFAVSADGIVWSPAN